MIKKYLFKFWVSLSNYKNDLSDQNTIILDKDALIRKTTNYEDEILIELYKSYFKGHIYSNYLLEVTIKKDVTGKKLGQFLHEGEKKIKKAITILRLFKKEVIGYNFIVQPLSKENKYDYNVRLSYLQRLWAEKNPENYALDKKEVQQFVSFYKNINKKTSFDKYDLAIEYFNKSYTEPYTPRDSFLDLMITLENLFLKGTNQELSYKISMRMAYVLGKDKDDRKNIFGFIKNSYNLRSKIVHGEESNKLDNQIFLELRKFTKESIIYFLENEDNWNGKKLDGWWSSQDGIESYICYFRKGARIHFTLYHDETVSYHWPTE